MAPIEQIDNLQIDKPLIDPPLKGEELMWIVNATNMFKDLFFKYGYLESEIQIIKDNLVRRDVRRFERTEATSKLINKIMMGEYSHIGTLDLSREECGLLLTMLGIEERLT